MTVTVFVAPPPTVTVAVTVSVTVTVTVAPLPPPMLAAGFVSLDPPTFTFPVGLGAGSVNAILTMLGSWRPPIFVDVGSGAFGDEEGTITGARAEVVVG